MSQSPESSAKTDEPASAAGISSRIKASLTSGMLSDVSFTVGRQHGEVKTFPAHKYILGISSEVFRTMFYGSWAGIGDQSVVDIPEIHPDAFANMLSYMYTDRVENLNAENVFPTMYCADKYDLPSLVDLCWDLVRSQLNTDTCAMFLDSALCFGPADIVNRCLDVVDASTDDVLQSEHFSDISQNTLMTILLQAARNRRNRRATANVVYAAVEKWAVAACQDKGLEPSGANRREVLGAALNFVPFTMLTGPELSNGPAQTGLLLATELLGVFVYIFSETASALPPHERSQIPLEFTKKKGSLSDDENERDNLQDGPCSSDREEEDTEESEEEEEIPLDVLFESDLVTDEEDDDDYEPQEESDDDSDSDSMDEWKDEEGEE
ncbi:BTB/POZ domain-containing protein 6-like isoform X2 [Paramacrobiotus metropolitanus]|uniref:BTB/POZ domain-containing protein 6-like isoform X2 n=1 Tax=Paramacrobiotus metropolitanus TaxID=2943436 RepID=UPI002445F828|nr:BTB/POZ domain-containing protein 6-like isoform X2 [Paramacrobiotus metropolitanus]